MPAPRAGSTGNAAEPAIGDRVLLLIDGVCNLCNGSVRFILPRDRRKRFVFASLQSAAGQRILERLGLDREEFHTMVLLEGDRTYLESTAALRIFRHLGGLWRLVYGFILVPRPVRDRVYRFIARNRYRWFGRSDQCSLPTPEMEERFLD
jgi:predicted DCC family thiol-disulfide oxidoreductase YuxK